MDSVIDVPAWESCLIFSSTNKTNRQKWQRSEPERSCANWSNSYGGGFNNFHWIKGQKDACLVGMRRSEAEGATTQSTCAARMVQQCRWIDRSHPPLELRLYARDVLNPRPTQPSGQVIALAPDVLKPSPTHTAIETCNRLRRLIARTYQAQLKQHLIYALDSLLCDLFLALHTLHPTKAIQS